MTAFTRDESRRVDALAQTRLLLPGDLLMENAGAWVARTVTTLAKECGADRVVVVCGTGNTGGDGFVTARHLASAARPLRVRVVLVGRAADVAGDAKKNLERLRALAIPVEESSGADLAAALAGPPAPVAVDALFGTGLSRPVAGPARAAIEALNASGCPIVAVDLPSGLDCDTGEVLGVAVRATRTVTFVAPKVGFTRGAGAAHTGTVEVASIGFPPAAPFANALSKLGRRDLRMNPVRAVLVVVVLAAVAAGVWFLRSEGDGTSEAATVASGSSAAGESRSSQANPDPLAQSPSELAAPKRADVANESLAPAAGAGEAQDTKEIHAKVTGRVVDEGRRPVAGASVRVTQDWFEDGPFSRTSAKTVDTVKSGADGRFAIDVKRSGDHNVLSVEPANHVRARVDLPALTDGERDVGDVVTTLGGSMSGRIVDEAGNAIQGAKVEAWSRGKNSSGAPGLLVLGAAKENQRSTSTDARGFFRLDGLTPGEIIVVASKEAYTTESKKDVKVDAGGMTNDISLALGKGSEIRGVIVDAEGRGVPDATVNVMDTVLDLSEPGIGTTMEADRATKTDSSGSFVLGGLRAGTFNVTARKQGFVSATAKGVESGTRDARIVLEAGGSVWGIVSDDTTGKAVKDFKVDLGFVMGGFSSIRRGQERAHYLTGADAAKVAGVPEQPGLFAYTGIDGKTIDLNAEAEGFTMTKVGPIEIAPGTTVRHDVSLVPEITVSGTVRDPKGQPVAKARVSIQPNDPDDGDTVVSNGGRVTRRFRARAVEESNDGSGPKVTFGNGEGKSATTADAGHFVIRGLSAGKFTASAKHSEWAPSEIAPLKLAQGERRDDVDLVMRAGGRVAGTTMDENGQPLPGAHVSLASDDEDETDLLGFKLPPDGEIGGSAPNSAVSDATGHYEIKSVLPGRYRAQLTNPNRPSGGGAMIFLGDMGGEKKGTPVEVREGETAALDLAMPPTGTVTGTVNEAGKPLAGVAVALKQDSEMSFFPTATATTNDRGEFEMKGVEPGKYFAEVSPKGAARPIKHKVDVRARSVTREEFTLPTGVVRGTVKDQDSNKGVAGVVIEVEPAQKKKGGDGDGEPREHRAVAMVMMSDGGDSGGATTLKIGSDQEQVVTDKDGNWEARYLEPGDYTVSIRGAGVIPQKKDRVRVFEGKESDRVDFDAARGSILKVKATVSDKKEIHFIHVSLESDADPGNREDRGEVGAGPVEFTGLAPGTYTVKVDSEGKSGEMTVEVKSGDDRTIEVPIR